MGAQGARQQEVVLDAGALIGLERGSGRLLALLERARKSKSRFFVPAAVLAQAWREGARQVLLARFVRSGSVEVVALTEAQAKAAGTLCGLSGTRDVVDASVVVCARERNCPVITGDPKDLRALDAELELHVI